MDPERARARRAAIRLEKCLFDLKVGFPSGSGHRRGGGDEETRTPDPLLAKEMLCQLSYVPSGSGGQRVVGAPGLEPGTSALSGPRSNQLSYAPRVAAAGAAAPITLEEW